MALALAASVSTTAHAASVVYTSAGITASGGTGELTSPSYTGVTNNFQSETFGYNFVFAAGSVGGAPGAGPTCGTVATCATSQYGSGASSGTGMWAIPTNTTTLGANGAFLALDSDFNTQTMGTNNGEPVTETLTGLISGDFYNVTFNTADTQQNTYNGPSEDQVQVCLGATCATTALVTDASDSDTPWVAQSYTFQASATSEALTFLGMGGTNPPSSSNVPAFALVDDVTVTNTAPPQVPEPNSLLMLSTGLLGLGGYMRMRCKSAASKA